jgi:transglutaminase-like putative cysteine protease
MKIAIRHQLSIGLQAGTARAVLHILATPQSGTDQTVREWGIDMPGLDAAPAFTDAFGNRARLVTLTRPDAAVTMTIAGIVETIDRNGVLGRPAGEPVAALFRRGTALAKPIGAITSRLRNLPRDGADRIGLLHTLMDRVGEQLTPRGQSQAQEGDAQGQAQGPDTPAGLPPAADFAHAFIGAARALDIPARYVGGYLSGDGAPAAVHAWAEAWDDALGWIGFDPMLGVCPTDRHVRIAAGLDASSVAMVRAVPAAGEPAQLGLTVAAVQ